MPRRNITYRSGKVLGFTTEFIEPRTGSDDDLEIELDLEEAASDFESSLQSFSMASDDSTTATTQVIVKKKLSRWALQGLDISEPGFSKLHSKESHFEKDGKHYDLNPETFRTYRDGLIEKVERMFAKDAFNIADTDTIQRDILKEYTRLTEEEVRANRDKTWTDPSVFHTQAEADNFTDVQLKVSTIGSYINESLEAKAKAQLKAEENFFKVKDADGNTFFDGPSYFFKITEVVDPDNGQLIDDVKRSIRTLNVKDFGFSVIKMLAEFKNLKTRVMELGGTYSTDEQFFDFWQSIGTMQEEEFKRYAKQEKDSYSESPRGDRESIDRYIKKFCNKEVRMRASSEWNVMSQKDSMVMALVTMLDEQKTNSNVDKKPSNQNNSDHKELSPEEKLKRRESRIPEWKKVPPAKGESNTMERDGRTYFYCTKCRDGKGMWALHTTENHRSDFKSKQQQCPKDSKEDTSTKDPEATTKKVSFAAAVKGDSSNPSIQVKKSLLTNAKAYLAQFSDFPEGGSQAE
jgi:hypothetical protein